MSLATALQLLETEPEREYREKLKHCFVAEDSFLKYFEEIEEEGDYPDLLGKYVVVDDKQFPRVNRMIAEVSRFLEIDPPITFVKEDYQYLIDSDGIRRPRIEISARMIRDFSDRELLHSVSKELFHIKSQHMPYFVMTEKMFELLEAIPNLPGLNIINQFGGGTAFEAIRFNIKSIAFNWFKLACFLADNFATAYVGDLRSSLNATLLTIVNERKLVKEINLHSYLQQVGQIQTCLGPAATLEKINEQLPYGPERVLNILRFVNSTSGRELHQFCQKTK